MTSQSTNVRISATDFGPIASGAVDMRPLTVFVGPSNTGKTYFAILVYALHRVLDGFPRFPAIDGQRSFLMQQYRKDQTSTDTAKMKKELQDFFEKFENGNRPLRFSDLPDSMRKSAHVALNDPQFLGTYLETELERCFDLESLNNLVRLSARSKNMRISIDVIEEDRILWGFQIGVSKSKYTAEGNIEDIVLLPAGRSISKHYSTIRKGWQKLRTRQGTSASKDEYPEELLAYDLIYLALDSSHETHYLPAARSGIMQSHRVITSSLVGRSTRGGLERFPELPTLSGVMVDFMQRLILFDKRRASSSTMAEIAKALENDTLVGQIRAKASTSGGYPEFVYRPQKSTEDIRLSRASSMVSELAPVVLFLRDSLRIGDMLIIEEPEAHLHPAAQTQMAVTLARLVRAGVKVVVTTHSDWLLKEIGNLIREGELGERTGETAQQDPLSSVLSPSEVGIWLFRKTNSSNGSEIEEVPFDRVEGVEPKDYEEVAEELYNRSAGLQNQLAETLGDLKQGNE